MRGRKMADRDKLDQHLAWLIAQERSDWDQAGIKAQLVKLRDRPFLVVAAAATTAAHTNDDSVLISRQVLSPARWFKSPVGC